MAAFGLNARSGGGLVLPGGNVRRSVHHPTLKKKPFPEVAQRIAQPLAAKETQKVFLAEFGKSSFK